MFSEHQYLNLIKNIIKSGNRVVGRNGPVYSKLGVMMQYQLRNGEIPLITTKKLAWKTCLRELLWFIKGVPDNNLLKKNNVKIWDGNSSREYLDSVGLEHYREGELGPIYGYQWRNWNKPYIGLDKEEDKDIMAEPVYGSFSNKEGIDQLQNIINALKDKEKRHSRRLIMTAWNPEQIEEMALPPCHVLSQFHVSEQNELSCTLYQRSGDVGLGIPFNIASYSFLTHILAKHTGLYPGKFIHFIADAHIYEEHIPELTAQVEKQPYLFPSILVKRRKEIEDYTMNDIEIFNYKYHKGSKMRMKA